VHQCVRVRAAACMPPHVCTAGCPHTLHAPSGGFQRQRLGLTPAREPCRIHDDDLDASQLMEGFPTAMAGFLVSGRRQACDCMSMPACAWAGAWPCMATRRAPTLHLRRTCSCSCCAAADVDAGVHCGAIGRQASSAQTSTWRAGGSSAQTSTWRAGGQRARRGVPSALGAAWGGRSAAAGWRT
jgi:hypothetical protein